MAAGKQKNTPVIVMKKKRHIISPPPTEEHVITPPLPELPELPELPSGTVENKMPAHQAKKKWTPEFINTSLEKVKALFPLLQAEEGGFRPLKIGITRDVTDFITLNPDVGLTLPEWQGAARIITRRWKYLERISVPGALRYGIDGLPTGIVFEHEARHARAFLASRLACKNKRDGRER
ncbi:hypothetical protein P8F35_004241 [Salmonella enterica]|nr:hypothetical protein [Salmonella enterica subsp. enterica]EKR2797892.1 hypothetical protein [Salmonella enterica]EKR3887996.1 hypothetical protein [Salmonella enterica]EKR4476624.1 hypothetical protein [Salmonella enterica]EKR4603269.1 hypothetical protein [Salmonella enterica]